MDCAAKSIVIDIFETARRAQTPYAHGEFLPKSDRIERGIDGFRLGFYAQRLARDIELALIDMKVLSHPATRGATWLARRT
jgi:hypothetical protein